MSPHPEGKAPPPALARPLWWIIWAAILGGATVIYLFLGHAPRRGPPPAAAAYIGLAPLAVSAVLRWLVLPRFGDRQRAFPIFIVGVALAESCTVLGTFLGGAQRDAIALLGLLGVVQWVPLYLSRMTDRREAPPASFR